MTLCSHKQELSHVLTRFPLARVVTGKVLLTDSEDVGAWTSGMGRQSSDTIEFLHSRLLVWRQSV